MTTAVMIDHTRRLPAETLNEIIDWIDERDAMHASAHVCRRWRYVAFDRPRRFCWFDCRYQLFPWSSDVLSLALCLAQLKCPSEHGRMVDIHLDVFKGDALGYVLNLLASKIPCIEDLSVTWSSDELTERVFDALSSQPAPVLHKLALKVSRTSAKRSGPLALTKERRRLPRSLFKGMAPALNDITFSGVDLPEEPLPQFSSVTAVDVEPNSDPWCCQDLLTSHFPAMSTLCVPSNTVVRLSSPTTTEGQLLLGRLTQLYMNERMLNDVLTMFPELSTVSYITAWPDQGHYSRARSGRACSLSARMVGRMLAHFAHDNFVMDFTDTPNRDAWSFGLTLSSDPDGEIRRDIQVPLSLLHGGMRAVFDEARAGGHELRLSRAILSGRTFTALWPILPVDTLRTLQVLCDPQLPDVPPDTPPRDLPALRDFAISRNFGLREGNPPIVLLAEDLAAFLRATFAGPVARLRLVDVSVDEVLPEIDSVCAEVIQEEYLSLDAW